MSTYRDRPSGGLLVACAALVVALVALVLVLADDADGAPAPASPAFDVGAPGDTPRDQLPTCNPGPWDAARSNPDNAPDPLSHAARVCLAEPTGEVPVGPGVPPPNSTGYHFAGNRTNVSASWAGARQTQRVVNPNVCHGSACLGDGQAADFVAAWTMLASVSGPDRFIQVGWSENGTNWGVNTHGTNHRHVFTYDTQRNFWQFYDGLNLVDGQDLSTQVRHTASGFGWEYTNYVWWNGVWNQLDSAWLDIDPNGDASEKMIQDYVEVYVDPAGPIDNHPQWDASGGIHLYKRKFYSAFGWANLAQGDFFYQPIGVGSPPYNLYANSLAGALDQTVCSTPTKAEC